MLYCMHCTYHDRCSMMDENILPSPPRPARLRRLWTPLLLLLLAVGVRGWYFATAPHGMQFTHVDAQGYHWLARNLLEHGVYSMNTEPPLRADNVRAPLYPLFVAANYAIAGPAPDFVALIHILIDALTVIVAFRLGCCLGGQRVGRLTGLLYALNPSSWRFCNELLTEILFGFLLTTAVWMFARYILRGRDRDALRCGVAFGCAILCKPNIQFLPLALLLILIHGVTTGRRRWWRGAALMAGVIGVMLAPWFIRNRVVFGEWFYTRTFDDNLAHVSAVATLAHLRGEAVAPWSTRWEELYAEIVGETAVRYGWESVPEATLSTRARDARLQQLKAVTGKLLRAHPMAFLVSHTRWWLWSFVPQEHKFWYTHLTGQSWEALAVPGDVFGAALKSLAQGQVAAAWDQVVGERWRALPPLALGLWAGWGAMYALGGVLAAVGAWRLRPRLLSLFLLAVIFYVTFIPGPISQIRFRLPVIPLILLLIVTAVSCTARRGVGTRD